MQAGPVMSAKVRRPSGIVHARIRKPQLTASRELSRLLAATAGLRFGSAPLCATSTLGSTFRRSPLLPARFIQRKGVPSVRLGSSTYSIWTS